MTNANEFRKQFEVVLKELAAMPNGRVALEMIKNSGLAKAFAKKAEGGLDPVVASAVPANDSFAIKSGRVPQADQTNTVRLPRNER